MPAKRLGNLLNPSKDGGLGEIVQRAQDMGRLAQILRDALPPEQAEGLVAANIRDDGVLVVLAPSPAWASRLRFEADRLLETARGTGADVASCRIRVGRA